jgi:chemotaxis methyl-accepting protein methylase
VSDGDPVGSLLARLHARSGLGAEIASMDRLLALLGVRTRELGLAGAAETARRALSDPAEYALIEAHFAPPETWLFRYPESFERLRAFARACASRPVRVLALAAGGWCEPVSVAAAIVDATGTAPTIAAYDRNPAVFAAPVRFAGIARRGGVPAWAASRFRDESGALVPDAALVACVRAECAEAQRACAAHRARGDRFDVILFRNAAIYMRPEARTEVYRAIAEILDPHGLLLVGHAELGLAASETGLAVDPAAGAFALRPEERRSEERRSVEQRSMEQRSTERGRVEPQQAPADARAVQPSTASMRRAEPAARPGAAPREARGPAEQLSDEVAQRPLDASLQVALAEQALERQDMAEAERAVARALYLDRGHERALLLAAQLADLRGATDEAGILRQRALRAHLSRAQQEGGA